MYYRFWFFKLIFDKKKVKKKRCISQSETYGFFLILWKMNKKFKPFLYSKHKLTGNSGLFKNNSPRIQPQLHMSIAGPYFSSPKSSSGGRYHSVITLLVYGRCLSSALYKRAKPKSASFTSPL